MEGSVYEGYGQKWRAANQMTKRLFRRILFFSVSGDTPLAERARNPNRQLHPVCPPPPIPYSRGYPSFLLTTSGRRFKEIYSSSLPASLIR